MLFLLAAATLAASVRIASADELTVFSCHLPSGAFASTEAWGTTVPQAYMYSRESCANGGQGAMEVEVGASPVGYQNEAGIARVFKSPPGMPMAHYVLDVAESFTYGSEAGIVGQAYVAGSGEAEYAFRNLGAGLWGPQWIERTSNASPLEAGASCDGEGGPCPAHTRIASLAISEAEVTLVDETIPQVSDVQGGLLAGAALHGETEASFTASDSGPGIYSAWFVIDGKAQTPVLLDTRGGSCVDHGLTANDTPSFTTPTPCEHTVSASLGLDTASLSDGQHTVSVMVDDASGNYAVVYTGTIETHNAPPVIAEPAITGAAQVGSTLSATPARFAAVEGAGPLSAITGEWLRCTDAAATHCTAIAGATGSTYSPATSDVGYHLIYQDTISDNDGTTVSDSQPTVAVSEASNGVAGYGAQSNPASTGAVGGSGGLGGSGGGGSNSPVTVNVLAPGGAPAGNESPWQVTLKGNRKRVHRGIKLTLSGTVIANRLPGNDKLVYVRARAVTVKHPGKRGVEHIYGPWLTFAVTHTGAKGRFTIEHKFKLSGAHIYEFEAIAPDEAHPESQGTSQRISVQETAATARKHRKAKRGAAHHG